MGIIDSRLSRVISNSVSTEPHEAPGLLRVTPDVLAWLNDSENNTLASYPGPDWQDDEERPTAPPDYTPTDIDLAYEHGRTVGLEGGTFRPPSTWSRDAWIALVVGRETARLELEERERQEWIAEHDEIMAGWDAADAMHDCEARGVC